MAPGGAGGLGSGRLHTRLVALFSVIAAVPTVIVAIFASLLFQSGLEFWFSDRARNMLENTVEFAPATYRYELGRVGDEATTMAGDLADDLRRGSIDDPRSPRPCLPDLPPRAQRSGDHSLRQTGDPVVALVNGYHGMLDA